MEIKIEVEYSREDIERLCIEHAIVDIPTPYGGEFRVVYQGVYANTVKLKFIPLAELEREEKTREKNEAEANALVVEDLQS